MSTIDEIHHHQIRSGYEACYATGKSDGCGQGGCSHREDCLDFDLRTAAQRHYIHRLFGHIIDERNKEAATVKALETALDIRKFEIELYWKRAAYFWVFITASFAGFFWAVQQNPPSEKVDNILSITTCMGLCSSWAWCLVLRGSKYWQENWESHVDFLEDQVVGKLYKHVKAKVNRGEGLLMPYPFSVSKVNSLLGYYMFITWCVIMIYVLHYLDTRMIESTSESWFLRMFFIGLSFSFIFYSFWDCRSGSANDIMASDDAFYCRKYGVVSTSNDMVKRKWRALVALTVISILLCLSYSLIKGQ